MATMRIGLLATIGLAACMTTAAAQSSTTEDRLREALRQTVIDMRAAQDDRRSCPWRTEHVILDVSGPA